LTKRVESTSSSYQKPRQLGRALSETELKEVFELARRHKCVVSPRLLLRLSSVPLKDRWGLLQKAIQGHWTLRRVEAELSQRYGRKGRGKSPRIPQAPKELAYELLRSANWWLRFKEVETELPLPLPARNGVKDVWRAMQELKVRLEEILPPNPKGGEK